MHSVVEVPIEHMNELPVLARLVFDFAPGERIFLMHGPMGAGKTTFIKDLCRALGSRDNFSSPTYSIINQYQSPAGPLYHMDLYRVKDSTELLDLGVEEYLHSGHYCFIEWPELAGELLDAPHLKIELEIKGNIRYLRLTKF